jgi:hypothetical protein
VLPASTCAWRALQVAESFNHKFAQQPLLPTWYVLSNLSYMNLVIMLVLPTDWSPKKTCSKLLLRRNSQLLLPGYACPSPRAMLKS